MLKLIIYLGSFEILKIIYNLYFYCYNNLILDFKKLNNRFLDEISLSIKY